MIKIDTIDKQISDLLLEDGRMSCARIAAQIGGITERTVRYRIERLIAKGIIAIRANVIAESLGLDVCADVFIECDPSLVAEIAKQLATFESISYIAYSTGENDISIQLFARSNSELFNFVTNVIGKIPGVRRTHTSFVPIKVKDDHVWPIPSYLVRKE